MIDHRRQQRELAIGSGSIEQRGHQGLVGQRQREAERLQLRFGSRRSTDAAEQRTHGMDRAQHVAELHGRDQVSFCGGARSMNRIEHVVGLAVHGEGEVARPQRDGTVVLAAAPLEGARG